MTNDPTPTRPDDEGALLVEYGLLGVLIAVTAVVAVAAFGAQVAGLFSVSF